VTWSLEHGYEAYPRIEEEFSAVLDESTRAARIGCSISSPAWACRLAPRPST